MAERVQATSIVAALGNPRIGKLGIDVPLGWPREYVQLVRRHDARRPLVKVAKMSALRMRQTDLWIHTAWFVACASAARTREGTRSCR